MKEKSQQLENGEYTDKDVSISDLKIENKKNFVRIGDTPFAVGIDEEKGPVAVIGNYIVYTGSSVAEIIQEIEKVNWHLVLNAVIAYNNVIYEVNRREVEEKNE